MFLVYPRDRERFFLRMLLLHVRGATSFEDLRTFEGTLYPTFHAACQARNLLIDDTEWERTLAEASTLQMPYQLRQLFAIILGNCNPSDPLQLWRNHNVAMCEDFLRTMTLDLAEQRALAKIENILMSNYGLNCTHFGLPTPSIENENNVNVIDFENEAETARHNQSILNDGQSSVVNRILDEMQQGSAPGSQPRVYFVEGPGGTGKTMVYNTLIAAARAQNKEVASGAWTGIAGTLLRFGGTLHSLFKLPVPILETSSCNVSPTSAHAAMLRGLSVILIDEASMVPKHALDAIDRCLRDIMGNDVPFGGKLLLFGGDFRQTLPVVPRSTPTQIIENCIKRSPLWPVFQKFELTENMRVRPGEQEFSEWLLRLGNGTLQSHHQGTSDMHIDIPEQCEITDNIVDKLFPDFTVDRSSTVILTPKNEHVLSMNDKVLEKLPGQEHTYYSTDSVNTDNAEEAALYSPEFLHSCNPSGMPQHCLKLKVGAPIMLLRNLNCKEGLCNGVRLIVRNLYSTVIDAEILSESHRGSRVLIPKMLLAPSDANLPFILERCQFPVKLAYVMTINKAQGQTFDKVGIYLPEPVFSHGQLYVAFSRARAISDIVLEIKNTTNQYVAAGTAVTINVVYTEVL